jgi:hypothetical protein
VLVVIAGSDLATGNMMLVPLSAMRGRIAVTGVSRTPKDHGANVVYKRLCDRGYTVFAINPTPTRWRAIPATTTSSRSPGASTVW